MALRLLEIAVPSEYEEKISTLFRKHRSVSSWQLEASHFGAVFHVVLPAEETESLMDEVETSRSGCSDLRMVLVPVEASIPRVESKENEPSEQQTSESFGSRWRVSREELYEDATDGASVSSTC